jgi:hypothetical protein
MCGVARLRSTHCGASLTVFETYVKANHGMTSSDENQSVVKVRRSDPERASTSERPKRVGDSNFHPASNNSRFVNLQSFNSLE